MPDALALDHEHDHLSDVGRMVRDALEVLGDEEDAHRPRDRRRVVDHVREQLAEDLPVQLVDLVVAPTDREGELGVLADERVEALSAACRVRSRPSAGCRCRA